MKLQLLFSEMLIKNFHYILNIINGTQILLIQPYSIIE